MLGSPIEHSLSPTLHRAAYAHLGLNWTYDRVEVDVHGLASFVHGLDASWRGLSLTMPLKAAVLELGPRGPAGPAGRRGQHARTGRRRTLGLQHRCWRLDLGGRAGGRGAAAAGDDPGHRGNRTVGAARRERAGRAAGDRCGAYAGQGRGAPGAERSVGRTAGNQAMVQRGS